MKDKPVDSRRKTSLNIDPHLWGEWLVYIAQREGSFRKASALTAEAIKEFMQNHPVSKADDL